MKNNILKYFFKWFYSNNAVFIDFRSIININCQHLVSIERGCRSSVECIPSPLRYSHPVHLNFPTATRLDKMLFFSFRFGLQMVCSTRRRKNNIWYKRAVSRFLGKFTTFIGTKIIYDGSGGEITPGNGYGGQKYEKRNKK